MIKAVNKHICGNTMPGVYAHLNIILMTLLSDQCHINVFCRSKISLSLNGSQCFSHISFVFTGYLPLFNKSVLRKFITNKSLWFDMTFTGLKSSKRYLGFLKVPWFNSSSMAILFDWMNYSILMECRHDPQWRDSGQYNGFVSLKCHVTNLIILFM